jgi:hypothetical protein
MRRTCSLIGSRAARVMMGGARCGDKALVTWSRMGPLLDSTAGGRFLGTLGRPGGQDINKRDEMKPPLPPPVQPNLKDTGPPSHIISSTPSLGAQKAGDTLPAGVVQQQKCTAADQARRTVTFNCWLLWLNLGLVTFCCGGGGGWWWWSWWWVVLMMFSVP